LIVAVLGSWRITHLLHGEDGPWRLLARVRQAVSRTMIGEAFNCFLCLSIFVAAPMAIWVGEDWKGRVVLWPALSAGAILIERAAFPATFVEAPDWTEDKEV
jgi:hypothetical protein